MTEKDWRQAWLDEPNDEAVMHVTADWLEDRDDHRSGLVRQLLRGRELARTLPFRLDELPTKSLGSTIADGLGLPKEAKTPPVLKLAILLAFGRPPVLDVGTEVLLPEAYHLARRGAELLTCGLTSRNSVRQLSMELFSYANRIGESYAVSRLMAMSLAIGLLSFVRRLAAGNPVRFTTEVWEVANAVGGCNVRNSLLHLEQEVVSYGERLKLPRYWFYCLGPWLVTLCRELERQPCLS